MSIDGDSRNGPMTAAVLVKCVVTLSWLGSYIHELLIGCCLTLYKEQKLAGGKALGDGALPRPSDWPGVWKPASSSSRGISVVCGTELGLRIGGIVSVHLLLIHRVHKHLSC